MTPLVWALLAFLLWAVAHLLVWLVRRPAGEYAVLLGLSLAVLGVSLGGVHALQAPVVAWNFAMLYTALVLAYIVTYSAVQADSPTMAILLRMERSRSGGLTREEMLAELTDQVLVVPRLDDLVKGNLVGRVGTRYVIRRRGAWLAKTYILYRALLKMEKGG